MFKKSLKIEKQTTILPIENHDVIRNHQFKKHGKLFGGESKRGLFVGGSGCGKTNVLLSLIVHPNGLRFENIYIYSKTLNQPKYAYLRMLLEPIEEIGYFEFNDGDEVISPENIRPNSIIIFDDVVTCNQNVIKNYFCFGRHKHVDCFYLAQTYAAISKQLIRDNANLIILFQQDMTNLKHIYEDHVNVDMSFDDFKDLCKYCWKDKYDFVVIDKECSLEEGRYRKGFDNFIKIKL